MHADLIHNPMMQQYEPLSCDQGRQDLNEPEQIRGGVA